MARRTESGDMPQESWDGMMERIRQEGIRMAEEQREQGKSFKVAILAPRQVQGGAKVRMMGVTFALDWKMSTRLEMIELARDLITKSYVLDELDFSLLIVLGTIIEGKSLYEHSIGEFFELYGRFEQEHKTKGPKTKAKMMDLVDGDSRYLKDIITEGGKVFEQPLPYGVRNILAHKGTDPNTLEKDDIRTSIELLESWVVL